MHTRRGVAVGEDVFALANDVQCVAAHGPASLYHVDEKIGADVCLLACF